jgi:hypothetical protein
MISFTRVSELVRTNKKWIWIGLAAVSATRLYYVQELIAALIIFSVLFVCSAAVVLIIFFLDRASQHVMTWAEAGVPRVLHRIVGAVEGIVASPVSAQPVPHRIRKEQFKEKWVLRRSLMLQGWWQMKVNLRQEIVMWVLGLVWTGFALFGFDSVGADANAMLIFLPTLLVLLVPVCLVIFSLRDRKKSVTWQNPDLP